MAAAGQHVIAAPLDLATRRMPESLLAGGAEVAVERVAGVPQQWRWRSPSGGGRLSLSPLTSGTTGLVVTPDAGTATHVTDALTVELIGALERTWAPAVPPAAARPATRRLRIAAAVAALLVPALALAGTRMLAPPKPMDVAAAVAQFRNDSAAGESDTAPARRSATPSRSTAEDTDRATGPAGAGVGVAGAAEDGPRPVPNPAPRQRTRSKSPAPATQSSADGDQRTASRSPQRSQRSAPPAVPTEGVYRYATQGHESIDQPSSRHDYPSETAMTIRHNDCGFIAHWQPLDNRWDEMTICRSNAGSFIPTMATHREFYGQAKDSRYTCSDDFYAYRPQPGATWTGRCTDDGSQMQIRARTFGREVMRVGDQTVEAVHYVIEARITGDNEGTWRAERWVDPRSGLLLRARANTDATSTSSFGTVQYHEETHVRLLSMTPER